MDYYKQIDKALKEYEEWRPYPQHSTEWICNRICWCRKFGKITKEQQDEFCSRAIVVVEEISQFYNVYR